MPVTQNEKFRPRARLLQLLGDQLIGNNRSAVFELVKNAYDADASEVSIRLTNLDTADTEIEIRDNGEGMSRETITDVWLEPGADFRERQRRDNKRSAQFLRLPLGEKGVGRFAVHKLGTNIEMRTKRKDGPEYKVSIDWNAYAKHRYMDEAPVSVEQSATPVFKKNESGTRITLSGLRGEWKRGDIRRLWRNVKSISSPIRGPQSFAVRIEVPEHREWLDGLLDTPDFLDRAIWHFVFQYADGKFEWTYSFKPLPGIKVEGDEKKSEADARLKLSPQHQRDFAADDTDGKTHKMVVAEKGFTTTFHDDRSVEQIGPILGEFFAFDRDREVLEIMPEAPSLTQFLDDNGGVRVFRDGVRVYNYGERSTGDDWLGLDQRRVNIPTRRLSNNLLIGAIELSLEASGNSETGLVEKTNREGFVENSAYEKFRAIVLGALIEFENLRQIDKDRVKKLLRPPSEKAISDLLDPINQLKDEFEKRNLTGALGNHLRAIESKFNDMKELMAHSGNAGLNLGILFHEIERGVRGLTAEIRRKAPSEELLSRAEHLSQLLDGFSTLLRKDKKKKHRIKTILRESRLLNEGRFANHKVVFSCPPLAGEQDDFEVNASFGMMLGALSNIIDNAIYWLQVRWPSDRKGTHHRAIYIGTTDYYEEGPALIIADNGPGLPLETAELVKPFVTMKPDGMGLGLYYVNLVCELNNARLILSPDRDDVGIPSAYDGAAFAILFPKSA